MKEVSRGGLTAAKHLRGDLYEVKADTNDKFFRVLFAAEGEHKHVLADLYLEWYSSAIPRGAPRQQEGMIQMSDDHDFLDEIIAESTKRDPRFPLLLDAAERRRTLLKSLVAKRKAKGISQTVVAARMRTSQSAVARLEGQDDAKESLIDRYAAAIGVEVRREVVDLDGQGLVVV